MVRNFKDEKEYALERVWRKQDEARAQGLERENKEKNKEKEKDMRLVFDHLKNIIEVKAIRGHGWDSSGDVRCRFGYNDIFQPGVFSDRVYNIMRTWAREDSRDIEDELLKIYESDGWKSASVFAENRPNWYCLGTSISRLYKSYGVTLSSEKER